MRGTYRIMAWGAVLLLLFTIGAVPVSADTAEGIDTIVAHGIDVSGWKGEVDWEAVAATGVEFVILRAGTSNNKDSWFERNYTGAKAAGLDVGCYFYSYATTPQEVTKETEELLSWLEGKQMEYPIYFDIEDTEQETLTTYERTVLCLTFLQQVKAAGWCGGVYSYKYWFENLLDLPTLMQQGEIWWAHWPASGKPDTDYSDYGLWQYASDGRVDGVDGDADLNVAFTDYPTLMKRHGWNGFPVDPTLPPEEPDEPEKPVLPGDVNGDEAVNTTDARLVLQFAVGKIGEDALDLSAADVDRSDKVDTTDARLILQKAVGKIGNFD